MLRQRDTYYGKDPHKLRKFLLSCNLVFMDRPDSFSTDPKKIRYLLSYLRGPALGLFEPYILDLTNSAPFMHHLSLFIEKLESNFSPYDLEGDAEVALTKLDMKENHHINRYIIDFTKYASHLAWNEPALWDWFYRGMPLRLRTELLRGGKPTTLSAMQAKAQECDQAYWAAKDETNKDSKPTPKGKDKPTNTTSALSSSSTSCHHNSDSSCCSNGPSHSSSNTNAASSSSSSSSCPNNNNYNNSKPSNQSRPSNLSNKLGRDGKLTSEEHERRMKQNLCLYCGVSGHTATN